MMFVYVVMVMIVSDGMCVMMDELSECVLRKCGCGGVMVMMMSECDCGMRDGLELSVG